MIVNLRNSRFKVNPRQFSGTWELIDSGRWEPQTIEVLTRFLGKNDTFLDLGAWAGPITLFAADHCARVHAIEPDQVVYDQLVDNVALNESLRDKVSCHYLAISNQSGTASIFARESFGNSSTSLLHRARDQKEQQQVPVQTLQDFIQSNKIHEVDLIKMDTESAEYLILPSIPDDYWKELSYPTLLLSFHPPQLKEHLLLTALKSKFLAKVILKLESWFPFFNPYKKEIHRRTQRCFKHLHNYQYIYTAEGHQINHADLSKQPINSIKTLIFSTKEWDSKKG
jgi:FkbM family methyltransferase